MKCETCICDNCDGVDRKCLDLKCLFCEHSRECPAKILS